MVSITTLPINWILITTMVSNAYLNIDLEYPHSIMPFASFLALILGPTGLLLGIRGFRECNRTGGLKGVTPAIIGAILCSITITIGLTGAYWSAAMTLASQSS